MQARALILEEFNKPLRLADFDLPQPGDGEVLARITAAGICGSDIHMREGRDPRTPLPIILGHEGVGEAAAVGPDAVDVHGEPVNPGDPIVWERSLTCGMCTFCRRGEQFLCRERKVYGINISCAEPPYLSGNYAEYILLRKGTLIFPLEPGDDPATLVAATCSGTTAAHAHEQAGIIPGDSIIIFGAGPVAIFQAAFAKREGADDIVIITNSLNAKAKITPHFGATEILTKADTAEEERADAVMDITRGIGADVVIDTTPDPSVFREAVNLLRRGGTYVNNGAAVPSEPIALDMYSDVTSKNITIRGTWASDTSHLDMALELVRSGGFPFEQLVTHRFPLEEHEKAFESYRNKEGIKMVFVP